MKVVTTLLLAVALGLGVYVIRRRIKLAFTVAAVAYFIILPVRLLFSAGELAERADDLVWPVFGLLVLWVIGWFVSTRYERRRKGLR